MRSTAEIEQFIQSLKLSRNLSPKKTGELDYGYTVFELWWQLFSRSPSLVSMQRFARFGLVFGYGDSFVYNQQGFLIIGYPGVGKTPTITELEKAAPERIKILNSLDCILLNSPDNKRLRLQKFPDELAGNDWPEVVRNCINYVDSNSGYPLNSVIYMDEDIRTKSGFGEAYDKKYPPNTSRHFLFGINANRPLLDATKFLYYNNNRIHPLPKVAQDILERLAQAVN